MECFCKTKLHSRSLWVFKPLNYWKKFSKNLVMNSIAAALQPVDCKSATLVKKEVLEISRCAALRN